MKLTLQLLLLLALSPVRALPNNATGNDPAPTLQPLCNNDAPLALANPDVMFVPWSEVTTNGVQQVFDAESAQHLVNVFTGNDSLLGKLANMIRGKHRNKAVPIYIEHPDFAPQLYKDSTAYGWVKELKALANGLELHVEWTPAGRALVNGKRFKFYSPFFEGVEIEGRKGCYRPIKLNSVGLTNNHNMPVRPLANSEGMTSPEAPEMGETPEAPDPAEATPEDGEAVLAAVRFALGIDPSAARDDVLTALGELRAKAEALPAAEAARDAAVSELEAARAASQVAQDTTTTEVAAKTAAEAEAIKAQDMANSATLEAQTLRERFVEGRLIALQNNGRLRPRDYQGVQAKLLALPNIAALDTELATLAAASPALRTEPSPGVAAAAAGKTALAELANSASAADEQKAKARHAKLMELQAHFAGQKMSPGDAHNAAWNRLRRDHSELL